MTTLSAEPMIRTPEAPMPRNGGGRPAVAMVLGGGGARGFAHIHALEALDELGLTPSVIAGSSIGALIGAGYASGMRGWEIASYCRKTLGDRAEVFARLWRLRPRGFGGDLRSGLRPGKIELEAILDAFLPDHLPATFEELEIPLLVTATDYYGQSLAVFRSGELKPAVAASAAIPALFRPIVHQGRVLIDGGIVNPVPFDLVAGMADLTVAIDVVGGPSGDPTQLPSTLDSLFGSSQLLMQAIIREKLKNSAPDVFLRPKIEAWRVMDFLKVNEILEATRPFRDDVKRAIELAMVRSGHA